MRVAKGARSCTAHIRPSTAMVLQGTKIYRNAPTRAQGDDQSSVLSPTPVLGEEEEKSACVIVHFITRGCPLVVHAHQTTNTARVCVSGEYFSIYATPFFRKGNFKHPRVDKFNSAGFAWMRDNAG